MTEKEEERINIYNYLLVLAKYRRLILVNFLVVCFLVLVITLLLPNWYKASTTLLPPEKEGLSLGLSSSLLSGLSSLNEGMSLPFMATPSDVIAAILKSRRVGEEVIDRADLMKIYQVKNKEEGLRELNSHLFVSVSPEGLINLSFEDKKREKAASVANLFIQILDEVNRQTKSSKAKNARMFVEERLTQTQKELISVEESLKVFQQKNQAISLDEQMKAAIQAAATLKGEIVVQEIELNVLKKNFSADYPPVKQLESKIVEARRQLDILEFGRAKKEGEGNKTLEIPFAQVPKLSLELARLMREVKIQETVFALLTEQYEQLKIQETKDTPTIQVLDKAFPPEKKARPKRFFLVVAAGGGSVILSIILVFFLEYFQNLKNKNPEDFQKIEEIFKVLNKDVSKLKRKT
jgi:tyrosine-protein kinase Etk/Wzc